MTAIRILLVDDHPLFRQGVAYTLSREPDMEVVGEAASGKQALALARSLVPDVILLDITMPDGDGLATAAQLSQELPETRIIMLTASEEGDDLVMAMKVGARGYVVKGAGAAEVIAAVRAVAAGEPYITSTMAISLLLEMTQKRAENPLDELTEREGEVLELLAKGMTNREIGQQLSLAERTVKHYVSSVLQKLHVRSRVEAALLVQKHGSS